MEVVRMRSKEEMQRMLDLYDNMENGDADATIELSCLILGMEDIEEVWKDGKDRKRTDRGNKTQKK